MSKVRRRTENKEDGRLDGGEDGAELLLGEALHGGVAEGGVVGVLEAVVDPHHTTTH